MRPGRLDRILYVGAPDLATRKEIFKIRFGKMSIEPDINVDELASLVCLGYTSFRQVANDLDGRMFWC